MKTTTRALLLALALTSVPVAAHAGVPFEPTAEDDPELVTAWSAWEEKGIDDYTTAVRLTCFCPEIPVVRTVVRNGKVRSVTQGGKRLGDHRGHSMDQLFKLLRNAYETADGLEVTYTSRGVPKSIAIDQEELVADEESYYSVSLSRS